MAVKYYIIKNRSASRVCYQIPEDHIRRTFAPNESKKISYDELLKLTYQPGGKELIMNFLQITDIKAVKELNIPAQPEYFLDEKQIIDLLKNGSLDQFLDCLDFAPVGVIELIKKLAIDLPLSDYNKKKALVDKFGYDVDQILKNVASEKEDGGTASTSTQTSASAAPTGRRTAPKYNVVSTSENK